MAKPMPCVGTPCGVKAILTEATPTRRPLRSISGPPELPGIDGGIGLERFLYSALSTVMVRPFALRMPRATEEP